MPKQADALTPSAVQNAKPKDKPYKLADGRGMFLLVKPDGAKLWRWRYRRPGLGTENMLGLGAFPTKIQAPDFKALFLFCGPQILRSIEKVSKAV